MKKLLGRLKHRILLLFIVIISVVLFACSDKPSPKASGGYVQVKSTPSDPAYVAALSDGIDFAKPAYPAFIAETQGISSNELWGRWTDGDKATIKFKDNLPRAFYLELVVKWAFGPNFRRPVRVRVGVDEQTFTVTQTDEIFRFEFLNVQNINTIEIIPPTPASPKSMRVSNDARRLGIGLVKLRIIKKETS